MVKRELIDEFIAYCEEQFGVTVIAEESENSDTFEKIFGELQIKGGYH